MPASAVDRFAVASALREISLLLAAEGADRFRVRAFARAARSLECLEADLGDLVAGRRLTEIQGVGPALAGTITELAQTGRSALLVAFAVLRGKEPNQCRARQGARRHAGEGGQ